MKSFSQILFIGCSSRKIKQLWIPYIWYKLTVMKTKKTSQSNSSLPEQSSRDWWIKNCRGLATSYLVELSTSSCTGTARAKANFATSKNKIICKFILSHRFILVKSHAGFLKNWICEVQKTSRPFLYPSSAVYEVRNNEKPHVNIFVSTALP